MRCNIKWLSMYIDGELSDKKKKKLEEHLKVCDSCSWNLQELKMVDAYANLVKEPQISEAYWENFTSRVKNKLLIREKQSSESRLWGIFKSLFKPSPTKLKFATAIASVLVVALVGKLYLNYKGISLPENTSSKISSAPSEQKPLGMTDTSVAVVNQDKNETSKPAVKEDIQVAKHSVSTKSTLPAITKSEVSFSPSSVSGKKEVAQNQSVVAPTISLQPESSADLAQSQKSEVAHMRVISKESASFSEMTQPDSVKTSPDSERIVILSAPSSSELAPSGTVLPKKETRDSSSEIDSLRARINHLQELIPSISNDSILEPAYLDLAQTYFNLCSLTKDKKEVETALKTIDRFLKQYLFPDTRGQLTEIEQKLKNLQKSLE